MQHVNTSTRSTRELVDFLRRELAGVDLTDVRLEAVTTLYRRWGFQSRLRIIPEYGDDCNATLTDAN